MSHFVKNPDEIILEDVKMVHFETMEEGRSVWLGIYLNNGKMYHLNIGGDNLYDLAANQHVLRARFHLREFRALPHRLRQALNSLAP